MVRIALQYYIFPSGISQMSPSLQALYSKRGQGEEQSLHVQIHCTCRLASTRLPSCQCHGQRARLADHWSWFFLPAYHLFHLKWLMLHLKLVMSKYQDKIRLHLISDKLMLCYIKMIVYR